MFKYSIDYYDNDLDEQSQDCGLVSAATIGEAATKVSDFYGSGNVNSLTLEPLEDAVLMKDELVDLFTKH